MRHALARAATRSAPVPSKEDSSAVSISICRPGRLTWARTVMSARGTGPSTSMVTRVSLVSGRGAQRSNARTSRAEGGLRCCIADDHGPTVCSVEANRSAPSEAGSSGR
jgi:hypothetical protein